MALLQWQFRTGGLDSILIGSEAQRRLPTDPFSFKFRIKLHHMSTSIPTSNARQRLRHLIDALEERYSMTSEDVSSLDQDKAVEAILRTYEGDDNVLSAASHKLITLSDTLGELTHHVRYEAASVEAGRKRTQNSLLPMHHLPTEILAHIFELTLLSEPLQKFAITGATAFAETRQRLMMTCSLWRRITLGTAFLWNRLVWNRNIHPETLLRELERVGDRPVDIFLDNPFSVPTSAAISYKLQAVMERCRVFSADMAYLRSGLLESATRSAHLRTVILTSMFSSPVEVGSLDLSNAQALQYLWINRFEYRLPWNVTLASNNRITHLHLGSSALMKLTDVAQLLNECPLLEVLELEQEVYREPDDPPLKLQPFLNLRHLACDTNLLGHLSPDLRAVYVRSLKLFAPAIRVDIYRTEHDMSFLCHLRLPRLESVEITHDFGHYFPLSPVLNFIQENPGIISLALSAWASMHFVNLDMDQFPTHVNHLWLFGRRSWNKLSRLENLRQPADISDSQLTIHLRDRVGDVGAGQYDSPTITALVQKPEGSVVWKVDEYRSVWDWRGEACGLL